MPVVYRYKGYKFFFYSNEGDPLELLHVHVRKAEAVAKFWLDPDVAVAESYAMTSSELRELMAVAKEKKELFERCWNEYFGV